MAVKNQSKNQKIKIHPISYVLIISFVILVILAIVLLTPTKNKKFKTEFNQKLIEQLSDTNKKELQQFYNYYDDITINNKKTNFNVTTISSVLKRIKNNELVLVCYGGLYQEDFTTKVGLFLNELKDHELSQKNPKLKLDLVLASEKFADEDNKFFTQVLDQEALKVDPYDYKTKHGNGASPIILAFYKGVQIPLTVDEVFSVTNSYSEINSQAKQFLDKVLKTTTA